MKGGSVYTLESLQKKFNLDMVLGAPTDMTMQTVLIPAPNPVFNDEELHAIDYARKLAELYQLHVILQTKVLLGSGLNGRVAIILVASTSDQKDLAIIDVATPNESLWMINQGLTALDVIYRDAASSRSVMFN
jgi:hypothetical protein